MKILLLRHGIAEDRSLDRVDFERKLTDEGKMKLDIDYPSLSVYLKGKKVRLVSSPLVRARETAEILKVYMPEVEIEEMDFVGTGDFEGFKDLVFKSLDYDYLLIVGHSPFFEEWLYEVTCHDIPIKKGSALEIELTDGETFTGKVNWYLNPGSFRKLGKFIGKKELKEGFKLGIEEKIDACVGIILDHREIYLERPEAIESVHKLRVKIRQFRSYVSFLKPLMKKRIYVELQNKLRAMAQECAYLRELDVLMKEWLSHGDRFKKEGVTGEFFYEVMEDERKKEERRLYEYLEKPTFAWELEEVSKTLKESIDLTRTIEITLDGMLNSTMDFWHKRIKAEYEAIDTNNLGIIHALRIKAKKIRYIMEVFELDKADNTKDMYSEIRKWQEVIGDITDANRNSEAVNEILEKVEIEHSRPEDEEVLEKEVEIFNEIQRENADALYMEFFGKKAHEVDLFAGLETE